MKINKIRIRNFKIFDDFTFDFGSADIVIFDGPNGFGKTTIYDAIELLFTGKIRRYSDLKNKLIDGRQTFNENPLYYENAEGKDIILTIEFVKNNQTYILERKANASDINGHLDFRIYKLYTKNDFLSDETILVDDQKIFLTRIFGTSYDSNFQFLNYVEQEESLFLLKHSDKERKSHIGHLFDLNQFEIKIKRIEDLKKKIDSLCNQAQKDDIDNLAREIDGLKKNISTTTSNSEYVKLFEVLDFVWDQADVGIKAINFPEVVGNDGVLEKLKIFIQRKQAFKQYRINSAINYILENEVLVKKFIRFTNFLERKDEFRSLKIKNSSLLSLITELNNLTSSNLEKKIDLELCEFIPLEIRSSFNQTKEALLKNFQDLSGLDKIYSDISASRTLLQDKLLILRESGSSSGECLLCGFDWMSIDELLKQIEIRSLQIQIINSDKTNQFNESLTSFKSGIVQTIVNSITQHLASLSYNATFVDELLATENNSFNDLIESIKLLKVDHSRFVLKEVTDGASVSLEHFNQEINLLKKDIDEKLIEPYFEDYFKIYFESDIEKIESISPARIEAKKNYLNYIWSLGQNELLNTNLQTLNSKQIKYTNAKEISKQLNDLKKIYSVSLIAYQKKIIKDIEIIFHIYSGRIMQSFQGGLGLFIFSEKDGIRFQSNPLKTYDAIFSMSSGQLSALIISFTLALHKKYSENKLVLIDDPVQTMDELNLYGFIDLLRNEFDDNQIIMSTHEDMMSAFMRYKFKNYNLSEKRINLKSIVQE